MNHLALPNRVRLDVSHRPGPLAQPTTVQISGPQGVQTMTFGGLTKLEHVAAMLACGQADRLTVPEIVDRAESILAECARRQKPQEQPVE